MRKGMATWSAPFVTDVQYPCKFLVTSEVFPSPVRAFLLAVQQPLGIGRHARLRGVLSRRRFGPDSVVDRRRSKSLDQRDSISAPGVFRQTGLQTTGCLC